MRSARPSLVVAVAAATGILACVSLKQAPADAGAGDAGADVGVDAGPDTGFTIVHQNPEAGAYRTVFVGSAELVYIAGDNGALIERKNEGDGWTDVVLGSGVDVGGVWASGPGEALAVATTRNTNNGPIFRRMANGRWIQIGVAPHGLRSVWGTGNMRYVGGNDGVIYSGPANDPLGGGVQISAPDEVAKTLFAPIIFSIGGNDEKRVMAAADVDTTAFFDTTWRTYADPIDRTRSFRAIWGPSGLPPGEIDIYQGANYYGLWHFTGSQNPVSQLNEEKDKPINSNRWIWGIWGPNRDKIICVGDGGRIMTWDKESGLLKIQPSPTGKNLYAIGGTSLDDIWIVGEEQLILHGQLRF